MRSTQSPLIPNDPYQLKTLAGDKPTPDVRAFGQLTESTGKLHRPNQSLFVVYCFVKFSSTTRSFPLARALRACIINHTGDDDDVEKLFRFSKHLAPHSLATEKKSPTDQNSPQLSFDKTQFSRRLNFFAAPCKSHQLPSGQNQRSKFEICAGKFAGNLKSFQY